MGQATLDDEDLFGEAAEELRSDVHEHLDAAEAALPDPDAIWTADAENVLGVLNTLRSSLDVETAREELRKARKWHALGSRAEAFSDADALNDRMDDLAETIDLMTELHDEVGGIASDLPSLRERLQEAEPAAVTAD